MANAESFRSEGVSSSPCPRELTVESTRNAPLKSVPANSVWIRDSRPLYVTTLPVTSAELRLVTKRLGCRVTVACNNMTKCKGSHHELDDLDDLDDL
jgi:hypothetical protein